jgi:hypothetical protein
MEGFSDRLALWVLRSIAVAMLFFGTSMLMVGVPAVSMLTESAIVRTIAELFLQIALAFIVGGAAATYLSRVRGPQLPNERPATSDVSRPPLGGWLIALTITLVALPVWLVIRLQPFFEGWTEVIAYLSTWEWGGADASGSGLILLPLAGALTPPLFELAAVLFLVAAPAMLLMLLLSRSQRFPRIYIVCLVLSAALVFGGVRSATAAALAGDAVDQLIQDTSANAEETAQLNGVLLRYTGIVGATAPVLLWTLCGYLIWIPPLMFSRRATTTFAWRCEARVVGPASATDLEAITNPPA